jgi:hypothetical protein
MSLKINAESCRTSSFGSLGSAYAFLRKNLLKQKHLSRSIALTSSSNLRSINFLLDPKTSPFWIEQALSLLRNQDTSLQSLEDDLGKILHLFSTFTENENNHSNPGNAGPELIYLWARVTYHKSGLSKNPHFDLCLRLSTGSKPDQRMAKIGSLPELLQTLEGVLHLPDLSKMLSLLEPLINQRIGELYPEPLTRVIAEIAEIRKIMLSEKLRLETHLLGYSEQLIIMRSSVVSFTETDRPSTVIGSLPESTHSRCSYFREVNTQDYADPITGQQCTSSHQEHNQTLLY